MVFKELKVGDAVTVISSSGSYLNSTIQTIESIDSFSNSTVIHTIFKSGNKKSYGAYQTFQVGVSKEEAAVKYVLETFTKSFLDFENGRSNKQLLDTIASVTPKIDVTKMNVDYDYALNANVLTVLEFRYDQTDFIIALIENDILDPSFKENELALYLNNSNRNYKRLLKYLKNDEMVIKVALENNQEFLYPDRLKEVFIF